METKLVTYMNLCVRLQWPPLYLRALFIRRLDSLGCLRRDLELQSLT